MGVCCGNRTVPCDQWGLLYEVRKKAQQAQKAQEAQKAQKAQEAQKAQKAQKVQKVQKILVRVSKKKNSYN